MKELFHMEFTKLYALYFFDPSTQASS